MPKKKVNNLTFRLARLSDLAQLTSIYNQAILAHQTADTIPFTTEQRLAWFESHQAAQYPLYIAQMDGKIAGYGTLSQYRGGRPALKYVVEVSYYLDRAFQGRGIGTQLLDFLLKIAEELNFKHVFAVLLDINRPSIALLEKFGFSQWGHLPSIAEINGQVCGQYIYGKQLKINQLELRE